MNITLDRDILDKVLHTLERHLSLIEDWGDNEELNRQHEAIIALRTALEQPEQEPVTYQDTAEKCRLETVPAKGTLLHTAPPQRKPLTAITELPPRPWVGLTDEEMAELWENKGWYVTMFKAVEAKLKEKNT